MNPLSPLTYYRRHKRSALLQIALISLATAGLFVLVAVLDTIPLRANVSYLTKLSRVVPTGDALDPTVISQIQTHPDVARAVPDNGLWISSPTLFGTDSQHLMGVSQEDAQHLMQHCGMRLKEGRMFEPRSNEFVLSEEVARALDLELGSVIDRTIDKNYYEAISAPLVLVGILRGAASAPSVRLGFVSAQYLESHERYAPRVTSLLVVPRPGRKAAVDDLLETTVRSKYTEVETFGLLVEFLRIARIGVYVVFGIVNSVVMRGMDVLYAFPSILLAIAICGMLGSGLGNTILALTVTFIPPVVPSLSNIVGLVVTPRTTPIFRNLSISPMFPVSKKIGISYLPVPSHFISATFILG